MKTWYHVFEPSTLDNGYDDFQRCAWCGNPERGATGTGHVDSEGEAARLNKREVK